MHHDAAVDRFYSTRAWRKCRAAFLADRGGLCEICLGKGLIEPATEVHHKVHITPENINRPEIALNWRNLVALCKDCHLEEHRKKRRWEVDADGRVTPGDPP